MVDKYRFKFIEPNIYCRADNDEPYTCYEVTKDTMKELHKLLDKYV